MRRWWVVLRGGRVGRDVSHTCHCAEPANYLPAPPALLTLASWNVYLLGPYELHSCQLSAGKGTGTERGRRRARDTTCEGTVSTCAAWRGLLDPVAGELAVSLLLTVQADV